MASYAWGQETPPRGVGTQAPGTATEPTPGAPSLVPDRKSTRLNSSHSQISYAVFCLKKKKKSRVSRRVTTQQMPHAPKSVAEWPSPRSPALVVTAIPDATLSHAGGTRLVYLAVTRL